MKTLLLSAFLLFASLTGLRAQDKYEFATVTYTTYTRLVAISTNGKEYTEEKVELSKSELPYSNTNPLINKVNELQNQGWEVIKIDLGGVVGATAVYFAALRKKKG